MSNRLGGKQGTAYTGTNANQPPNWTFNDRPPTQYDTQNVSEGDFWLDRSDTHIERVWVLVSLAGNSMSKGVLAEWVQLGSGSLESLTGNSGGPVFPDVNANINVVGDGTTIDIIGNPGSNTLTVSAIPGTPTVETLTGNSGGAVAPTAGNIDVLGTGVITVVGNPGTSTLTVTPSGDIASSFITNPATGIATPVAGVLTFAGTGGVTISAAASTVTIDGSGIGAATSFPTDSGTATPAAGVLNIIANNAANHAGASVEFTGSGNTVLLNVTDAAGNTNVGMSSGNLAIGTGQFNTSLGKECFSSINNGLNNVALGFRSSFALTNGNNNTTAGYQSLNAATTSIDSVAIGTNAISSLLTGDGNTCIGVNAGQPYNGAESYNIIIGSTGPGGLGVVGESNVLRIAKITGAGVGGLQKSFIQGIRGVTTDVNDAVAVLIDSAGQLGTVSSSMRYKSNIEPMGSVSDRLMDLEPVTFSWKSDQNYIQQIGLIAEEVEVVFPELVVHDKEGLPETVKYHELPVLLLNELKKLAARVAELEANLT